jgi:hypothetical protein
MFRLFYGFLLADIESLQILTEGFVNNCFQKKLKFFLSSLSENLENFSIVRSILKAAIDTYLHTQLVQTSLSRDDTKSMLKSGQIPIRQHQQIKDLPVLDNAKEIKTNLIFSGV